MPVVFGAVHVAAVREMGEELVELAPGLLRVMILQEAVQESAAVLALDVKAL